MSTNLGGMGKFEEEDFSGGKKKKRKKRKLGGVST